MPYSDIPFNLKKNSDTRDIELQTEERAIQNSVANILLTGKGEVFYRPNFGCKINNYLFEKLNEFSFLAIRDEIRYALYRNESRIEDIQVEAFQNDKNNELIITLEYRIKSLNINTSQTLTLGVR